MGTTEIVLLILGIVVFVISFILPAKAEKVSKESLQEAKEEIQKIVNETVKEANGDIEENVMTISDHGIEKAERAMERICNDKIMAINEYSSTVLESIDKNHKEVMFLYDMLNDKHTILKETVMEVDKTAKEVKKTVKSVSAAESEPKKENNTKKAVEKKNDSQKTLEKEQIVPAEKNKKTSNKSLPKETASDREDMLELLDIINGGKTKAGHSVKRNIKVKESENAQPVLNTESGKTDGNRNSNEKILELHNAGKSNVVIAKELGLGVGEVKLVIDLFEGK